MADASTANPELKLGPSLRREFDQFYTKLQRRQTTSAYSNARATIELLRKIVGSNVWKSTSELLQLVRVPSPERRLGAYPHELSGGLRQRGLILGTRGD